MLRYDGELLIPRLTAEYLNSFDVTTASPMPQKKLDPP